VPSTAGCHDVVWLVGSRSRGNAPVDALGPSPGRMGMLAGPVVAGCRLLGLVGRAGAGVPPVAARGISGIGLSDGAGLIAGAGVVVGTGLRAGGDVGCGWTIARGATVMVPLAAVIG